MPVAFPHRRLEPELKKLSATRVGRTSAAGARARTTHAVQATLGPASCGMLSLYAAGAVATGTAAACAYHTVTGAGAAAAAGAIPGTTTGEGEAAVTTPVPTAVAVVGANVTRMPAAAAPSSAGAASPWVSNNCLEKMKFQFLWAPL